jgi:hypothetical protein
MSDPFRYLSLLTTIKCPECGAQVTGAAGFNLEPGNAWPHHYRADAGVGCSHWGIENRVKPEEKATPSSPRSPSTSAD